MEEALRDIILKHKIMRQSDFVDKLRQKGFVVNQSTVSRLLNKIGAMKAVDDKGRMYYRLRPQASKYLATNLVHKIVTTETLVVVFTLGGAAGHVCEYIDRQHSPMIAGTIAGENTIFIAPFHVADIVPIENFIREIFM